MLGTVCYPGCRPRVVHIVGIPAPVRPSVFSVHNLGWNKAGKAVLRKTPEESDDYIPHMKTGLILHFLLGINAGISPFRTSGWPTSLINTVTHPIPGRMIPTFLIKVVIPVPQLKPTKPSRN